MPAISSIERPAADRPRFAIISIFSITLATVLIHWFTGSKYGFHRDELATLDDARHLAWGYVAYPPMTPFFGRLSLILFGTSLAGFRFFAALANGVSLVLTGLMARELGGGRRAQLLAVTAALPAAFGTGALMQYVSFDYLCWVLSAYFVIRLLRNEDAKWWIAVGAAVGFGLLAKYGMVFWIVGIITSFLLTDSRHHLWSKWFLLGSALAIVVFLPNLLWQVQNGFISLDFLKHIHERDVSIGRTKDFLPDQLKMTLLAAPLWLAGLYFCLLSVAGRRFRAVGWMYVLPLLIFVVAKGRGYYLLGAYPMLYAAGATWAEGCFPRLNRMRANAVRVLLWCGLAFDAILIGAVTLPMAPVHSRWWQFASSQNGDLVEEIGWPELVGTVANVRDSLPSQDRTRLGILTSNYGEAGAINLYGPQYGLPSAISGVNSFWQRGYGDPPPETLIVLGLSRSYANATFDSCRLVANVWNRYGVENEETIDHSEIFVCGSPKVGWSEFWKDFRRFG